MALVIDGVFFQLAQSGIARVWRAVLPRLAAELDMPIVLLDRGGIDIDVADVEVVPFPSYKSKFNAHDSALLEKVCRHYNASVFASTYYTTPLQTPSMLLVYDMIPERLAFDLTQRDWREKEIAIAHARRHVCISHNTRKDLLDYYPELDPALTTVAHCGIEPAVFKRADESAIAAFRRKTGLNRPYYIFVGSRAQHKNYKNASLFFDAVKTMRKVDFDVLCVGGEKNVEASESGGHKIIQLDLDDESLATAYSGAIALVYPSLYEGFGLPVAEAMSCGCPVISTAHGSLPEVTGTAALTVGGFSVPEMVEALNAVRQETVRAQLIEAGLAQASQFRWESFSHEISRVIRGIAADGRTGKFKAFYDKWAELRALQGDVDVLA
jgi:glycosyltransferase involved in cell wall biosynthesis